MAKLTLFLPRNVMVGIVNILAIFIAQLPQLHNASWLVYPMVLAGLAIIYGLPRGPGRRQPATSRTPA